MAGRPLGALTIAVLVAVLTSRIAPGDARFFVLQAQPEQENGVETNTYYLVNAAGVGTVRTYSSASQNTFSFGSPFAWFQQQLQIMESLQQAALQSLMFLQGQQTQSQGHDPTRSDDLSQTEMLQRVGCSRMRAAIMQQMQEAGTLPRSRSDAATQTEEYFEDYDGLPALTKRSYDSSSSSSSASSDSLYASTYRQQQVTQQQQQQARYEVQQQQEQQAGEWWAHQMDRATDTTDLNQYDSDGYGADDSDSAALDEAERAMDYAADRIMGLLSYLYRGYGEQEGKQQGQQQQLQVPDDVTPGWGAAAVEGQGMDQGDQDEGSGSSVLGFHTFIQSMMQQLLEDSLERSYDEEGSYDDQGSYDEEDSYSDNFTRADWTRRDWDEYYDSLYSNVGSEAEGDDYSGVLTLADAVLAHMELEDDYSYFDGDWIDLVDAYRFGGYDDGSYAEGGDGGDGNADDINTDDYASGIATLVARSSAAGRQQRYSDGSSSSSSNSGSVSTEAIMSTDMETGVTEVVAWSNVGSYVLQFWPTRIDTTTATRGDGYAYAQGHNPGEPFGGLWPFGGDPSGPQLPQEPVIVVNELNMAWVNADGSFNWGLLVLVLLLAATGAMVVTFVMSWLSLRRTMRASGCGGWVYAPCRYRGGKGGGKGWDALDEPLVLQPADCKGAASLGVEEAAAYVPPKVANESVATALTK